MKLRAFIKDKLLYLVFSLLGSVIAVLLLSALGTPAYAVLFLCLLFVSGSLLGLTVEFLRKKEFYSVMLQNLEKLDKKNLLSEMLEEPGFEEGKLLCRTLRQCNKSMNDEIAAYRRASSEYREYIETWVHEVKTPIASARLVAENNPGPVSSSLEEELRKIEEFVEQALFYARSNSVEKDYGIKKSTLRELVGSAVKKNSHMLIEAHMAPVLSELDIVVYTDPKWTDFILGQLLGNAVKYRSEEPKLKVRGMEHDNSVSLFLSDNGVGIPEEELPRVFDKGFTGSNGRTEKRSTGLGLYLCKKLCAKLNLGISLTSRQGAGTTVELVFPKSSMYFE